MSKIAAFALGLGAAVIVARAGKAAPAFTAGFLIALAVGAVRRL